MFTNIVKNKRILILILVLLIVVTGIAVWKYRSEILYETLKPPKPQGNSSSSFLYQEIFYSCSKEIPGEWVEAKVGQLGEPGYYFVPANQIDLEKFCRMDAVIEYRAVIDILKREDVSHLIEKYDTAQAWVRALSHVYINNKDFLRRILPAYSNMKIDCIIVVHSPEGTRFFIENGEKHITHNDHKYMEIDTTEFLESLNNAPDTDVTNFWLGLH